MTTPHASAYAPAPTAESAVRLPFPFTALVGQSQLQLALQLAAIDPGIGGLLISGPRGTAKSTAARALAALLPGAPFVTLPLAASLEQLVGTLNVEDVLRDGQLRLAPGMVTRAHGGVLYVDEVNLLPDALVDALLDVAASGVNTVERDGISQQHAARFVLVGTMNPEEGDLRPQLLDRFGLSVALSNPVDAQQRAAILRARLEFDADPAGLVARHAPQLQALGAALVAARAALPRLAWSDQVLRHAADRALEAGVDGLRADLVMLRAARALAALQARDEVTVVDVDAVAELALAHRRLQRVERAEGQGRSEPQTHPQTLAQAPPRSQDHPLAANHPAAGSNAVPTPAPQGDWGALPAQPVGLTPVQRIAGWPPKKA
ncbi:AAA family ATPase [Hylemonella gracilis]|uniref:AAA family ATPase n=1 Tax=Hylemonella gracilis TaxID=80880 RepID=A0A4V1A2M3_9BURK|nr:AAA family ATPase [Hylemonella gracilis]QBK06549.1 AAA family ATPase [Hylemonella gracilis]